MEYTRGQMEGNTKATMSMIRKKVKVLSIGRMEENMMDSIKWIKKKGSVNIGGKMGGSMKDFGRRVVNMGKES